MLVKIIWICIFLSVSEGHCFLSEEPMLQVLDAMQYMMTGSVFDRPFYANLKKCMSFFDPGLPMAQEAAWAGIILYWAGNGTDNDPWGNSDGLWMEHNMTRTNLCNMTIYEPCNYASNVAYYHIVTELCARHQNGEREFHLPQEYLRAMAQSFSMVAFGSAFMHGSNTRLGGQQDLASNDLMAFVLHQASLSSLKTDTPELIDLSAIPRNFSSIELAQKFTNMYSTMSVYEWEAYTKSLDIPHINLSFAAIISTILSMSLEPPVVNSILPRIASAFGLSKEHKTFITTQYLPEIHKATQKLKFGRQILNQFIRNSVGTFTKLIYAFLWQEKVLPISKRYFLGRFINRLGWMFLPSVNQRVSGLQTFKYFKNGLLEGVDAFPGDSWCTVTIPHAKWHLQSALGILDLSHLVDDIYRMLLH